MAIPSKEKLIEGLRAANEAGDIEAVNEIAAYIDSNYPEESAPAPQEEEGFFSEGFKEFSKDFAEGTADVGLSVMSGVNRAAAGLVDLPSNLVNLAASGLGGAPLPTPTQLVDRAAEAVTGERPIESATSYKGDNWASRLAGTVSEYAAFGGLAAKGAQMGAQALVRNAPVAPTSLTTTSQRLAASPTVVGQEARLGALGGIGGGAAREFFPDNAIAELAGSLITMTGGALTAAGIKRALQQFKNITSHDSVERAVSQSLQETVEDLPKALDNLKANRLVQEDALGETTLTATQLTQDPSLIAAIDNVATSDSALLNILKNSKARTEELAINLLEKARPAGAAVQKVAQAATKEKEAQQVLIQNLTTNLEDEVALANNLLAKAEFEASEAGGRAGAAISEDFVKTLKDNYDNAVDTGRKIWQAVDQDIELDPTELRRSLAQLSGQFKTRAVKKSDIPTEELKTATKLSKDPSFANLAEYRSTLTSARAETTSAKKSAMLREMVDTIDTFLDDYPTVSADMAAARNYTRLLKTTYDEGKLGRFLQTNRQGALRIDPEAALTRLVGAGGDNIGDVKRAILVEQGQGALPPAEGLTPLLSEFLRTKFAGATNKSAFLKKYEQTLNLFPALSRNLSNLSKEIDVAADALAIAEGRRSIGLDNQMAKVYAALGKDPDRLFQSLNTATRQDVKNILSVMEREGAAKGFQAVYLDEFLRLLVNNVETGARTSGSLLSNLLKDNKTLQIGFSEVLTGPQRKALRDVEKNFQLLAPPRTKGNVAAVRESLEPNALLATVAKILSIGLGSKVAPSNVGALQTASQSASFSSKIIGKLTQDQAKAVLRKATVDPDYLEFLLTTNARNIKDRNAQLNSYFMAAGVPLRQPDTEEEQ